LLSDEFCLSIVSLVLNVNDLLKSEFLPEKRKKHLTASFKRLIRDVDKAKKVAAWHEKKSIERRCPSDGLEDKSLDTC
jgi:hypothetical protein